MATFLTALPQSGFDAWTVAVIAASSALSLWCPIQAFTIQTRLTRRKRRKRKWTVLGPMKVRCVFTSDSGFTPMMLIALLIIAFILTWGFLSTIAFAILRS